VRLGEETRTREEDGVSTLGAPLVPRPFTPPRATDLQMYGSARVRPRCAANAASTGRDHCSRRPQDLTGYQKTQLDVHCSRTDSCCWRVE